MENTDLLRECIEYNKTFGEIQRCFRKLEYSFKHYLNIFNSIRDAIVVSDLYRNIIDVNKAFTTVFGYAKDEILGKNARIIFATEENYAYVGREVYDSKHYTPGKIIETDYKRKNGEIFRGEVYALKLVDEDFKLAGNLGIIRDITTRTRLQDELQQSNAKYKALSKEYNDLLDLMPDSVNILSKDLRILWANHETAKRLNMPLQEIAGKYCYNLLHKRNSPCEGCPAEKTIQTAKPAMNYITHRNGKIFEVRTFPVLGENNEVVQVRKISREVTEQKKLEEQLSQSQKMEAVGQLAGGISHDFNNILAAAMGYAELIKLRTSHDKTLNKYIDTLITCLEKGSALTQRLLLFSRKQIADKKLTDINGIIINFDKILRRIIPVHIEIRINLTEKALTSLVDVVQIEQVLMNLAANARDAMKKGGIFEISTDLFNMDERFIMMNGFGKKGAYVRISIKDTGEGINENIIQRIFEPFYTTKDVGKGTGLGLSIVYNIVKEHDGYITVKSESNVGTCFDIYLPYIFSDEYNTPQEEKRINTADRIGITVLLAEDNEELRESLRGLLNEKGCKVIEAENGEEAVRKFHENKDDIKMFISDIIMPKKNGLDAYQEMLVENPGLKVIFMSGYPAEILTDKRIFENNLHFINKPIFSSALLAKMAELL